MIKIFVLFFSLFVTTSVYSYDLNFTSQLGNDKKVILTTSIHKDSYSIANSVCKDKGGIYATFSKRSYVEFACNNDTTISFFILNN